jgi:hypothetical protein
MAKGKGKLHSIQPTDEENSGAPRKKGFADEWRAITGEPYQNWLSRIHPDDVVRVITAWVHARKTKRFSEKYRLRDTSGMYVWVRIEAINVYGWQVTIARIAHEDSEHVCFPGQCYCGLASVC